MTLTGPVPDTEQAETACRFHLRRDDDRGGVPCPAGRGRVLRRDRAAEHGRQPGQGDPRSPSRARVRVRDHRRQAEPSTACLSGTRNWPKPQTPWCQCLRSSITGYKPGRIDVGFLSAAQLDRHANLNSTVIGPYDRPSVRLPGAGGAPEIAGSCGEVIIIIRQSRRTFVEKLDFVTSVGYLGGPGDRARLGLQGKGPTLVITDLGLLRPRPGDLELELTHLHPGVNLEQVRQATGWELAVSPELARTAPPDR